MVENPLLLIKDFVAALRDKCGLVLSEDEIVHEHLRAPHSCGDLPPGKAAVYVFTLTENASVPAGLNRALKVGKAGPKSNARFRYQHYKIRSANSTLAGAIQNNLVLQYYIGLNHFPIDIGRWIQENTDRDNFFIDRSRKGILALFEIYLKGRLGPVFEGSLNQPRRS